MGNQAKKALTIFRWLLSALFFALFVMLISSLFKKEELGAALGAAPYVIFALVFLITAILLLIPETVKPTCNYLSGLITGFIMPDQKFKRPALTYDLARSYIKRARYDDAIVEYKKIIHYYPDEVEAYLGIISACGLAGETLMAEKYQRKLKKRIANKLPHETQEEEPTP